MWFNNEDPTLSALDKEMISHVPQGGNWQDIPDSVPSKRLEQIREMSKERGIVRTTYYGRLSPDQPAYTISTYYNRPGNGTHIHPIESRTLTSREAARLQSFPDAYQFFGTEGAIRNQIGNAVPPLLSYALGKVLASTEGNMTCVDVFCGAGGLSLGLEWAGWDIISSVDNNEAALNTYKKNRLDIKTNDVIKADLQEEAQLQDCLKQIKIKLGDRKLHLLVGGPPCQGFSYAGFRSDSDARNDLAVNYLNFAKELKPEVFLLENVEGLLTMKKGQVIKDLINSLEEIGYTVVSPVWKLNAEEYGVPQMRRRVFLIATLNPKYVFNKPQSLLNPCLGRRKNSKQLIVSDTLNSPINVAEAFMGLSFSESHSKYRDYYSSWVSGSWPLQTFIEALNK